MSTRLSGRFWNRLSRASLRSRRQPSRRTFVFPLRLERLEDRQLLATVSWIGATGGLWSTPGNWSGGAVPAAGDDVVIDIAGGGTVIHSTGTDTIHGIASKETLNLTGGTLKVTGAIQGAGGITLAGGALDGATVEQKITATTSGGTLNGVTLKGDTSQPTLLDLSGVNRRVDVVGDLTLDNASINIQGGGGLGFTSSAATLGGTGAVVLADNDSRNSVFVKPSGGQLTVGPGITIPGAGGTIGYSSFWGGSANVSVVNQGTIGPTQTGTFVFTGAAWTNSGTLQALGGGTLKLQPTTWSNTGLITETDSTLNLASTFTTAQLGPYSRSGGTINLTGTLDNTGSTLALTAATGSWTLAGGTILGGTVLASGGAKLLATTSGGTLNGVTLKGDTSQPTLLDLGGVNRRVDIVGDLALDNASINIQGGGGLEFTSSAGTLGGTGAVVLADNDSRNSVFIKSSGGQLTIGPGIAIQGAGGTIGYSSFWGGSANVSVVNQGIIGPTQTGTFVLTGAAWTNSGTLQALGGVSLSIQPTSWTSTASAQITASGNSTLSLGGVYSNLGAISATGSTVNLGGTFTLAQLGTFNRTGGVVNLTGTLTNTNTTFTLDAATGSWNLVGGTILGGKVLASGVSKLAATTSGGTLNGVTLKGDTSHPTLLDLSGVNRRVDVVGDLTLDNASINIQGGGGLGFTSTAATLGGTGAVVLADNDSRNSVFVKPSGGQLTVGPGITIRGAGGTIGYSSFWGGSANVSVVNQGIIGPTQTGTFVLTGAAWTNSGTLQALGGGTLKVQPTTWSNTGLITETDSTLNLASTFTTAQLGPYSRSGGTINLTGTLDNTGSTLALTAATGSWTLAGGTILGGTVLASGGAKLLATTSGGTLNGVTLKGDTSQPTLLDLGGVNRRVDVVGDLTLDNASINIKGAAGLGFTNSVAMLAGTGAVVFGDNDSRNSVFIKSSGGQLTIGPGIAIQGAGGTIGYSSFWGGSANVSVVNQGIIGPTQTGTFVLTGAAWTNSGTLQALGGGSLNIQPTSWTNTGLITETSSILNLDGTFTPAQLGQYTRSGGAINLTGTLDNSGSTLALTAATGSWNVVGGTILGGTVLASGGAKLVASTPAGTLNGVTLQGDVVQMQPSVLDLAGNSHHVDVIGDLVLDNAAINIQGAAGLGFAKSVAMLAGTGAVVFGDNDPRSSVWMKASGGQLTIGPGITIKGAGGTIGYSSFWGGPTNVSVVNQGTIGPTQQPGAFSLTGASWTNTGTVQTFGGTLTVQAADFQNQGMLIARNGGQAVVNGTLTAADPAALQITADSKLTLAGDLAGGTHNSSLFQAPGTLIVSGGTASAPRHLEVMSNDQGAIAGGFVNNFAYGSLTLASGAYVQLVDQADNAAGNTAEALYVGSLSAPAGTTLDLNGLKLYVRTAVIKGTVLNGSLELVPDGSQLALNTFTPGAIGAAGEIDEWPFFAFGQQSINVVVNPGSTGAGAANSPTLDWAKVELLDATNHVLAAATSASAGGLAAINGFLLPAFGSFKVRVQAASSHASSIGNYTVAVFNATPDAAPLNLNQPTFGKIETAIAVDRWTFSADAGEQVRFDFLNAQTTGIVFSLIGPNGYAAFTNLSDDSDLITLAAAGSYTLSVKSSAGQTGAYSFQLLKTTQADLPLNTTVTGTLLSSGQALVYRVVLPTAMPLSVRLDDASAADQNEFYLRFGQPPSRANFDYRSSNASGADQSIVVPSATPGVWYILIYGNHVPVPSSFTLVATASDLIVTGMTPDYYGVDSLATLTIGGVGFTPDTAVKLVAADGSTIAPVSQSRDLFTQITATFDLHGVPPAEYSLRADRPGGITSTLASALRAIPAGEAQLKTNLILPAQLGRHAPATLWVEYSNTGDSAMPAPLLIVKSADIDGSDRPLLTLDQSMLSQNLYYSTAPLGAAYSVQILASGATPGVLQPGESRRIPIYYGGLQTPWNFSDTKVEFALDEVTSDDVTAIDWTAIKTTSPHAGIAADVWNRLIDNVATNTGATWGDYVQMLDDNAGYVSRLGQSVIDVSQLWQFELMQANGLGWLGPIAQATDLDALAPNSAILWDRSYPPTIDGRFRRGAFGLGWSTPWQESLERDVSGNVTITTATGSQRRFQPDSRHTGAFFPQAGDHGVLTIAGGTYTLRETDGSLTHFNSNGTLDYIADAAGNRMTANYDTSGRLAKLTHSAGQSLTINYNAAGLISDVTDLLGRKVIYTYDVSQQYLVVVQSFDGLTTRYSYNTTVGAAAEHALTAVEYPDGTHDFFQYGAEGRLASVSGDNNASRVDISRDSAGKVTLTDNLGATKVYFDQFGLVAKIEDPLGRPTLFTYDAAFNLTSVTNGAGQTEQFTYDNKGNLLAWKDRLGSTTKFTYSALSRLTSLTDARGNSTVYTYDLFGNLTTERDADVSLTHATYDATGLPLTTTNSRGQTIAYQRNAFGQVTRETFPDGSHTDYAYDSHQNLVSVTDASGITTIGYDTADRLTKVTYPNGRFVSYSYDAAGRQSQLKDQSGYEVNYSYDDVGRLKRLLDASGATIVTYSYDAGSRLSREDRGNGTYSTYEYDSAGQISHLINYASGGSVQSRFDYAYNALGRLTGTGTIDGQWTYECDAEGQLIHAVFVSINPLVTSQDLTYAYDALGNRTSAVQNGVATAYLANNLNEYTSVGAATYHYDLDGNLTSITAATGTTNFTYDIHNRLTKIVSASGTTTFEYDAFGNRTAAVRNGARTEYLLDPTGLGDVLGQYDASGNLIAHFAQGLGLVSRVDSAGSAAFYDFDALGNTAELTSSGGGVLDSYSYLPFGEPLTSIETITNPFQFVGQYGVMQEGDLDFMRARFYSPQIGRFTQPDPTGLAGGDVSLYRYAGNNPASDIDPSGLSIVGGLRLPAVPAKKPPEDVCGNVFTTTDCLPPPEDICSNVFMTNDPGCHQQPQDECGNVFTTADCLPPPEDICSNVFMTNDPDCQKKRHEDLCSNVFMANDPDCHSPPAEPPPPEPPIHQLLNAPSSKVAKSVDPNDFIGPTGFGERNYIRPSGVLPYRIDFENDATATAPAQEVEITASLDPHLDWSTLALTEVGFGDTIVTVPPNSQYFQTSVPVTYNDRSFEVDVEMSLDLASGQLSARFLSIDPATFLPPEVLTGFLPPEDGTGRGQGYISYAIRPKADLPTGTEIHNVALVTFDAGETIATNQVAPHDPSKGTDPAKEAINTIDVGPPASAAAALTPMENDTFTLNFGGADDATGSGIAAYDVYQSDNGGPFTLLAAHVTQNALPITGQAGHTYRFYTLATDNVGNAEPPPAEPDTVTVVSTNPWQNAENPLDVDRNNQIVPRDALLVINYLNSFGPGTLPQQRGPSDNYLDTSSDGKVAPFDAMLVINHLNSFGPGNTAQQLGPSDNHVGAGPVASGPEGENTPQPRESLAPAVATLSPPPASEMESPLGLPPAAQPPALAATPYSAPAIPRHEVGSKSEPGGSFSRSSIATASSLEANDEFFSTLALAGSSRERRANRRN